MGSGNFVIGDSLSLEGFEKYVLPSFRKRRLAVLDRLTVKTSKRGAILTSIVGEGDLEKVVKEIIGEISDSLEEEFRRVGMGKMTTHAYQVSGYEIIGIYSGDKTASQLFPSIAQKYLLEDVEKKAEEIDRELDALAKRLSS